MSTDAEITLEMADAGGREADQYSGPWLWDANKTRWYGIEEPANWIATTDANLAAAQLCAMG